MPEPLITDSGYTTLANIDFSELKDEEALTFVKELILSLPEPNFVRLLNTHFTDLILGVAVSYLHGIPRPYGERRFHKDGRQILCYFYSTYYSLA